MLFNLIQADQAIAWLLGVVVGIYVRGLFCPRLRRGRLVEVSEKYEV